MFSFPAIILAMTLIACLAILMAFYILERDKPARVALRKLAPCRRRGS